MAARLANKTALISGAAQGTGEALAETFAAAGAGLMLFDIEAGCQCALDQAVTSVRCPTGSAAGRTLISMS